MTFVLGILLGGLSWWVAFEVSGSFEPYDSLSGFLVNQLILSAVAAAMGYQRGFAALMLYVFGAYAGLNAYAYIFGASETRAWAVLGAITSIILLFLPLLAGITARITHVMLTKLRQRKAA